MDKKTEYNVLKKKIKEQHLGITAGGDSRSMLSLALDCESLCTSDEQLTSHPETYNNSMSFWGDTPIITVTEDSVFSDPLEQKKLSLEGEQVSLCQIKVEMKATKDKEMGPEFALKVHHEHEDEVMGTIRSANDALDPLEKEWIYSAACGRLPVLSHLLEQEPNLVHKKDFTSGTGLHWAAKHGKEDMAILLANAGVDVNTRAHGGYTALHIAALHGHSHIMKLLIDVYGAKENLRDYSGRLPHHYLKMHELQGDAEFTVSHATERKNKKLPTLFLHRSSGTSKKKWGSAEDLSSTDERAGTSQTLLLPPFRPRKFSR
ncbi:ankyrin repeat domain-containing protein SOWAHD isoform X2 [Polypterus senegalus]|uniref:ankyrin repeat domain-containing protein SOWAHD isoform X2 n=1 Tax=Polypterus senegalus TaxID=55291 RepID=UPI00196681C1|nr:ankyrin repeat domain-containing protein SOWAHD isoform X2 [Polypterus senegalus]